MIVDCHSLWYQINIWYASISYVFNYKSFYKDPNLRKNNFQLWWNSVDRFSVSIIFLIVAFSIVIITTASPAIAYRIDVEPFYFMKRQMIFLSLGISCMIGISFLSVDNIKRFALIGLCISILCLVAVLFFGYQIKGSKRWLQFSSISIQPSEFVKPFFIVVTAWLFSIKYEDKSFPAFKASFLLYLLLVGLLMMQPDFGMVMTISVIWIGQLFISGLSLVWFFVLSVFGIISISLAYIFFPHVQRRIDSFLNPEVFENYQVRKSLEAFKKGGFYGEGLGEGIVKHQLPDSHTDFIFAVIGEEMGFIMCMFLLSMYALLVIRGLYIVANTSNNFNILAISGILMQIGLQSVFNMGVTLHLFPTKGMTLPLISYGGSSAIAIAIALGMMLAFSRERYDTIKLPTRSYKINIR